MKILSSLILIVCISISYALEGGPTQPDYAEFEPSGMKDMVNLVSGDFSYQIPLSDIPSPYGNYPLSLSYHAGISPQQEASWVGLGWNLNPGSINRDVRGVPDDQFHGGTLGFIYQYSAAQVWFVDLEYSIGVYSVGVRATSDGSVGYSATVGPKIAGVVGVGFTIGTDAIGIEATYGFSNAGLNMGLMYSTKYGEFSVNMGASIGSAGASMGAQVSLGKNKSMHVGFGNSDASVGMTVSSNGVTASAKVGEVAVSKGSNGAAISVGGGSLSVTNSATNGKNKSSTAGLAIVAPTPIGTFSFGFGQTTYEYWMRSATSEYLYGYMYQAGPAIDVDSLNNVSGIPDAEAATNQSHGGMNWSWTMKGRTLESLGREDMCPAYDLYTVASEGLSGTFRPFAREKHQLYKLISNKFTTDQKNVESYSTILENDESGWPLSNEFKKNASNQLDTLGSLYEDYAYCMKSSTPCSIYGMYKTNFRNRGNRLLFNSDPEKFEERGGMRFMFVGEGSGYYESDDVGADSSRTRSNISSKLLKKSVSGFDYALYGAKKVEPLFEDDSPMGKLIGFTVTTADGSKYIFKQPVHSYLKVDYSINREKGVPIFIDKSSNKYEGFFKNIFTGIKNIAKWSFTHMHPIMYDLNLTNPLVSVLNAYNTYGKIKDVYNFIFKKGVFNQKCNPEEPSKGDDYFFSYSVNMNPYATQWLLSEVRGADYVKLGDRDIGYNVKFNYTEPSLYRWRTPYARPGIQSSDVPNFRSPRNSFTPEGCDSRMYQASFGVKEYVYLKSIETSTHRVKFELNKDERVDGKGWDVDSNSVVPILIQTTLGLELNPNREKGEIDGKTVQNTSNNNQQLPIHCPLKYWKQTISVRPKYIYFNSPLPEKILSKIYDNDSVSIEGLSYIESLKNDNEIADYKSKLDGIRSEKNLENCNIELEEMVDFTISNSSFGKTFRIVPNSLAKTTGKESRYGLYKLELNSDYVDIQFTYLKESVKDSIQNIANGELIAIGENGDLVQNPYIDWSKFIFTNTSDIDSMENQMRYLTKISYYRKGFDSDSTPYKEYNFNYDYSLQPKTLNSYCKGRYPVGDSIEQIINSPDSVGLDICKTDTTSKSLYGKLTLRSITEKGCQNGKCATLPPFVFSYNSPSATSTRISTKDGWIDYFQEIDDSDTSGKKILEDEYFEGFGNIDATILASSNTTDEYGFWANTANPENHKVDQSFADYGAAAWSLNKVVDPTGGNLEVEYERDRYGSGVDYSQDKRTVEFPDFDVCSDSIHLCIKIQPLYWREQCLGPRAAYWDKEKPENDSTDGYAYLNAMGIDTLSKVFFNLTLQLKAKVRCSIFWPIRCTRHGSVAVVGNGTILGIQDSSNTKILIINRKWKDIENAALKAALKYNDGLNTINRLSRSGYLWSGDTLNQVKAGDLRVTKLTRHDIGLKSLTSYDYDVGELAQLADSSYTTVLGSRFYTNKVSYAIPDMHLDPISRVVGFDDDDLMYVPGAKITYPKVTVKNSSNDTSNYNGTTEFYYVTPETGIPEEYVDSATSTLLKPFVKLNVLFISGERKDDYDDGRVLRFTLLDSSEQKVAGTEPIRIIAFPDERTAIYFYSDSILSAKNLKVEMMNKKGADSLYKKKIVKLFDSTSEISGMNTPLTKFNEYSLVIYGGKNIDEDISKADFTWKRSQKIGFYPILYKQVTYALDSIDLDAVSNKKYDGADSNMVHFESSVTYHDLTAFLGQNIKTVFKRGTGDNAIIIKKDSSFYSTVIPDVIGQDDSVKYKVGRQKEKWSSELAMQCVADDTLNAAGPDDVCKKQQMHLYMRKSGNKSKKEYAYIRYPVFQIGSASYVGHDNQSFGSESNKLGKTELHNHAYDPLTGSPTATLATVDIGDGKVLRKLTQMTPYYLIADSSNPDTGISTSMFLRNMLTQNYMEALYTDTLKSSSNAAWNMISSSKNNLRSFSISPYRFFKHPAYSGSQPIVAWGTYNSKDEPNNLIDSALNFALKDTLPSLIQYSGTEIVSIDSNYKVTEVKDVLGRSMSTLFSNDGMFQLSIFYPAKQTEVGAFLPYRDTVLCLGRCSCSGISHNFSVHNGIFHLQSGEVTLKWDSIPETSNIIMEYRIKENGKSWESRRDTMASNKKFKITAGSKLNYFRVYPENAEAKSFIYDNYDNLIQIIAEDNTSTYYEYDPLGNLVQSRNDDGVSFKAHHREYMNDSATQKMKGE